MSTVRAAILNRHRPGSGMVCEYGMSRSDRSPSARKRSRSSWAAKSRNTATSVKRRRQIDLEVRRLIDEAYQSAHSLVESHADAMHRIARRF